MDVLWIATLGTSGGAVHFLFRKVAPMPWNRNTHLAIAIVGQGLGAETEAEQI